MVFSSVPLYLDPSHSQQQLNYLLQGSSTDGETFELMGSNGQALVARVAQPLKCPRCGSSNTKFCYFNNYSLSQPRHFCKTCRRYWTRGGILRDVPVGGGCRINKRTKTTKRYRSFKSALTQIMPHLPPDHEQQYCPFLPILHHLSCFGAAAPADGGNVFDSKSTAGVQQSAMTSGLQPQTLTEPSTNNHLITSNFQGLMFMNAWTNTSHLLH